MKSFNCSSGSHPSCNLHQCDCECHSVNAMIERAREAQQEHEQKHDVQLEIPPMSETERLEGQWDVEDYLVELRKLGIPPMWWFDQITELFDRRVEIHGPGPDCQPED